jgi:hypothetical protein
LNPFTTAAPNNNAMPKPDPAQIPKLVKMAIARTAGDPNPDPAEVDDNADMSDFNFSFFNYAALTHRLDQIAIAYNPAATISEEDVEDCGKVKDCIALVQKACKA